MPTSVKPNPRLVALVVAGGVCGSAIRVVVFELIPSGAFPWATVVINLLGALLIGLLLPTLRGNHERMALVVLGIGATATTFSALAVDTVTLLSDQAYAATLLYLFLSVVGGFWLAVTGLWLRRARW